MQLSSINYKRYILLFCIAGFLLDLIAYYPGFLNYDSLEQYGEALAGNYADWHPPIMSAFWRMLNHVYPGVIPMLVFQLLCFWISCYLLITMVRNKVWLMLTMLFSVAPFTQNFVGFLVKDSGMALTWLLAGVIMFRALVAGRRLSVIEAVVSILMIIYASWVRHNAFPGSIPFCIMWSWLILKDRSHIYKGVLTLFVALFLLLGKSPFEKKILHASVSHTMIWTCLMDISGIYANTGQCYFPKYLYACPNFDTTYLRTRYSPANCIFLWKNDAGNEIVCNSCDNTFNELYQNWIKAISEHPTAYIKMRAEGILYFLKIKNSKSFFVCMYPWVDKNAYGFVHKETLLSKILIKEITMQGAMPYMRPWFWFLLNIVLLFLFPFIRNQAYRFFYIVLVSSGLLYILPLLIAMNADSDFRYFYWNCIACSIACCLLIYDRYNRKQGSKMQNVT